MDIYLWTLFVLQSATLIVLGGTYGISLAISNLSVEATTVLHLQYYLFCIDGLTVHDVCSSSAVNVLFQMAHTELSFACGESTMEGDSCLTQCSISV
jgi:hypothetical protein